MNLNPVKLATKINHYNSTSCQLDIKHHLSYSTLVPKVSCSPPNAFGVFLTVIDLLKKNQSLLSLQNISSFWTPMTSKYKLNTSNIQNQRRNIPTPNGHEWENSKERLDQSKTKLQLQLPLNPIAPWLACSTHAGNIWTLNWVAPALHFCHLQHMSLLSWACSTVFLQLSSVDNQF